MKIVHLASLVLAIVGAVNWGLWGVFQVDLVASLCGGPSAPLSRAVYSLVGLAGLALAYTTTMRHTEHPAAHPVPGAGRV